MIEWRRCEECRSALAHDQRYCLACGARRGALPPAVAALIAGFGEPADASTAAAPRRPRLMPTPRAAATAVLGLLAFGVFVGSVASPAAQSAPAAAPLVVAVAPPRAPAAAPVAAAVTPPAPSVDTSTSAPIGDTAPIAPAAPPPPPPAQTTPAPAAPTGPVLPPVKHVFLIVLTGGHGYSETFGPDAKTYLATTLAPQGELVQNYYGVASGPLANEVALVSGQGPTVQTAANCPDYADVAPGTIGQDGEVAGDGCVYPKATQTLGDQLTADGKTWKAYVQDIGSGGPGQAATCRHPQIGTADPDQAPRPAAADPYETWRNPFVYFHSITDVPACSDADVGLDQLAPDLKQEKDTPAFSYIVPDACRDGSTQPCAPGLPAGLDATEGFLKRVIPEIKRSRAYRDGGLIAITFDNAPQSGPTADTSSCCDNPQYPNLPAPPASTTTTTPAATTTTSAPLPAAAGTPPGGGQVGLLLISPYVKPASVDLTDSYNHFSLLRSIEDLFGLDHLGYAADPALPAFDRAVYNG